MANGSAYNIVEKSNEKKDKLKEGIHDGHRDRMREKYRKNGFKTMEQHEILEILLY